MSNSDFDNNIIDSVLTVKASEQTTNEAQNDLNLPQGKTLAELFNDQKTTNQENTETKEEDTDQTNSTTSI